MIEGTQPEIKTTHYNRSDCSIGIVHLGFGAFHRAHQAVYVDDYMEHTGDLAWGIAAVNLRPEESADFAQFHGSQNGYLLKTTSPANESRYRLVRPHIAFVDWSKNRDEAEALLGLESVKAVTMTVTESGYYLDDDYNLNLDDPLIAAEIAGEEGRSIYAYLTSGLRARMEVRDAPITLLCCDNLRGNGEMLARNFRRYLQALGEDRLLDWIEGHARFPCSMVDRITPRATDALRAEISAIDPKYAAMAIHGESFSQWVLQRDFAGDFPSLEQAGVEIVENVDPFEEAKIRILNGAHTALCYLGALAGYQTFDELMRDQDLRAHFDGFESTEVLPGLTLDLPFDKEAYAREVAARFSNAAIADNLERICMDGWAKFSIFVRPTLASCLEQGTSPKHCYESIAGWYIYARRFARGQMDIPYIEPNWEQLRPMLDDGQEESFAACEALWSDLPKAHPEFVPEIISAIRRMKNKWPILK